MKIPGIELNHISRFRNEHMGVAILIIILFHVALPRSDAFFGLRRVGNIGVDIFLFLSGIGLWFSWAKSNAPTFLSRWWQFYRRRLLRVYPTWLVIACLYYIPRYHHGMELWADGHGLIDLMGDILINWDFWLHDELTFWYIPAILFLYAVSPFYMSLVIRHPIYRWLPVAMIMWCILVQYVTPIHEAVGHLEIFWSRVPIFFIGINMAAAVKRKETMDGASIWMIGLMFVMALASSIFLEQVKHGQFPLFLERMLYIPLTVTTILLLNRIFRRLPDTVNKVFRLVGTLSLEAYLIHDHFVLEYVERNGWSYWPTFLVTTLVTIFLAWMLHALLERFITPIENRMK